MLEANIIDACLLDVLARTIPVQAHLGNQRYGLVEDEWMGLWRRSSGYYKIHVQCRWLRDVMLENVVALHVLEVCECALRKVIHHFKTINRRLIKSNNPLAYSFLV